MSFTSFFIQRPVLSSVLNALIVIFGFLSLQNITFREYPNIEVPILSVEVVYPNASAEVVEYSVTNPIEDALSKVEGLEAMASSTKYERVEINLQLKEGSSVDRAMILVRDALSLARQDLPKEINEPIVKRNAERMSGPPFMAILITSPSKGMGDLYHFAQTSVRNGFRSVKGIAGVHLWGNPYTMTVNIDPKKMYALGVNIDDITNAFERNNLAFPAGKYRDEVPVVLDLSVSTPEEFEKIIIKHNGEKPILLSHIAKVVLKEDTRTFRMRFGGEPSLIMTLSCASDANALDVSQSVQRELARVQSELPDDVQLKLVLDQADFIRESLSNVKSSIIEAILLVALIIFIFLRNVRASLIPIVTIPIALVGVITILYGCGYSLNTTTLLALVLAVGLVVDDAIVVLENIYRYIEQGFSPLEAAQKGSSEIGFAILAMTITLASVFTPIAFLSGFTGKLLIEFAVTLSGAVLISGLTALTLSPMMCSRLLKHEGARFLPKVDDMINTLHSQYQSVLSFLTPKKIGLGVTATLLILINIYLAMRLPSELTPKEDRGHIWLFSPATPGRNLDALEKIMKDIENHVNDYPGVASRMTFMGDWGGTVVLNLDPIKSRKKSAAEMADDLRGMFMNYPSVDVYPASWDSGLPDLGIVEVYGEFGAAVKTIGTYASLEKDMQGFMMKAMASGEFAGCFSDLRLNYPSYDIKVDEYALNQMGISPALVSQTLSTFFSGIRQYHFRKDAIRYDITLQTNEKPWNLSEVYITGPKAHLISLASVAKMVAISVPKSLTHYNQMRSATFNMTMKPGESMAKGMAAFTQLKEKYLPKTLRSEWLGVAKVYADSSNELLLLLVMGLVFIYAVLAIQFESFTDPFIILLTVPLAAFGALLFLWVFGQSLNIFTKIGLLTLIGLITKHGILLVEFANQQLFEGKTVMEAALKAADLRLRPILMTTLAMVIGSVPLVLSSGAGAESRRAIGLTLVGGLSVGTLLTLTLIPFAYVMIKGWRVKKIEQK